MNNDCPWELFKLKNCSIISEKSKVLSNKMVGIYTKNLNIIEQSHYRYKYITIDNYNDLNKKYLRSIKSGKVKVDNKIDLHNLTIEQALHSLSCFIHEEWRKRSKTLLVITGKGRNDLGVIKSKIHTWINHQDTQKYITHALWAPNSMGGRGALYVILKSQFYKKSDSFDSSA